MYALLASLLVGCDDAETPAEPAEAAPVEEAAPEPQPLTETPPTEAAPTTGRLLVAGTTGAVFVDGESVGHLPMSEPIEVEVGDHELKVLDMKTGRGQELNVRIEAGKLLEVPAEG